MSIFKHKKTGEILQITTEDKGTHVEVRCYPPQHIGLDDEEDYLAEYEEYEEVE